MGHRTAPFLGKGLAFPFRINSATGQTTTTYGFYDSISVALQYLQERWTIRDNLEAFDSNHIAECIHHILFTIQTEHDTLPEFGSRIVNILFEPNSAEFRLLCESYLKHSTERWEKRAKYPEDTGVEWLVSAHATDMGQLPIVAKIEFLTMQHPKNLVAPFVDVRQARLQEYPSGQVDDSRHDLVSRYYGNTAIIDGDYRYLRPRVMPQISFSNDDTYYLVRPNDTWLLISWFAYGDIRYWDIPYTAYIDDLADNWGARDYTTPLDDPPVGELLRMPSKDRVKLIVLGRRY